MTEQNAEYQVAKIKEEQVNLPVKQIITDQTIKDYLFGSTTKLTDQQQLLFMGTAKAFNLNPFKREIYAYASGDKLTIVTGYEVYLKRAEDTLKLDGWKVELLTNSTGQVTGAKITIYRKDWKNPFEHSVSMSEYKLANALWNLKPVTMIKKVAIGQGFRLCFPNDLGGMPYLPEELPSEEKPLPETSTHQAEIVKTYPPLATQDATHGATNTFPISPNHTKIPLGTITEIISVDNIFTTVCKNGKNKFTIYSVPDNAGNKTHYITFSETLMAIAKNSIGKNQVSISFTVGQYGKDIKGIEIIEEQKKAVEDVPF